MHEAQIHEFFKPENFSSAFHGQNNFLSFACETFFYLQGDFSLAAKNEQKRRRPIIDSIAQDSDGNYIDQIASDSISYTANSNVVSAPENYPSRYLTG